MGHLWLGLHAYVIIRVKGARLETFVNMANREGIILRNVSRPVPDRLYCSVSVKDFRRLRPIIKALHLAVEIRRRRGLAFLTHRLVKRRALALGIVLIAILLYLASGFVWFINLDKVPEDLQSQIQALLEQAGVNPGIKSDCVDVRELERLLLTELDTLSWAAIELRGTAMFIEAVKRTSFDDRRDEPSHLVAAKGGVIESVITFEGLPVVREGQTVRPGDVLISGVVPLDSLAPEVYNNENAAETPHPLLGQSGQWGYLFADGLVHAITWYDAAETVIYDATSLEQTGKQTSAYRIALGGRTIIMGRKVSPYVEFQTEEQTWHIRLPWELGELTVTRLVYQELQRVQVQGELGEAKLQALEQARAKIRTELPAEATVLDEQVRFNAENGRVRAEVLVSARENIGLNSPIQVGAPPPLNWEGFVIND